MPYNPRPDTYGTQLRDIWNRLRSIEFGGAQASQDIFVAGVLSADTNTPTAPTGSPSVSIKLGTPTPPTKPGIVVTPTVRAQVTFGASVATTDATGQITLYVDGQQSGYTISSGSDGGTISGSFIINATPSDPSPIPFVPFSLHLFELYYWCGGGGSCEFTQNVLIVEPL